MFKKLIRHLLRTAYDSGDLIYKIIHWLGGSLPGNKIVLTTIQTINVPLPLICKKNYDI
jgi:hypothetical protein